MNYILMPYLMILGIFIIALLFSRRLKKKLIKKMKNEVDKSQIFVSLVEMEKEYKEMYNAGVLKGYPEITRSLKEIGIVLRTLGCKMDLNKLRILPVNRNQNAAEKTAKLLEEVKQSPDNVRDLLRRKTEAINKMAMIKHPITHYWNQFLMSLQLGTILMILNILLSILRTYSRVEKHLHKKKKEEYKTLIDTYAIIKTC